MTPSSIHRDESLSASETKSPGHKLSEISLSENVLQELEAPSDSQGLRWWKKGKLTKVDLDSTATQPSVFGEKTLELYRPPPSYENAHRFDPAARWTWREEKARD